MAYPVLNTLFITMLKYRCETELLLHLHLKRLAEYSLVTDWVTPAVYYLVKFDVLADLYNDPFDETIYIIYYRLRTIR